MEAIRRRAEAEILDLCAQAQERLAAAKAAYRATPTPETREARRQAMQEMHRLRAWLRATGRPVLPDGSAVIGGEAARPKGRRRRDA